MGGEDEVQTGGLLASVPEGAATGGEEVGQCAEGSSLAQMHTEMFIRLQRRSLRRQRLVGEHLGGNVASKLWRPFARRPGRRARRPTHAQGDLAPRPLPPYT